MERNFFFLMAVATLSILPSVHALNCTMYEDDYHSLCETINGLDLSEGEKEELMESDVYGEMEKNKIDDLSLKFENEPQITLETIYKEKIGTIVKLFVFIFVNYGIFSALTKPGIMLKWLSAVS